MTYLKKWRNFFIEKKILCEKVNSFEKKFLSLPNNHNGITQKLLYEHNVNGS